MKKVQKIGLLLIGAGILVIFLGLLLTCAIAVL